MSNDDLRGKLHAKQRIAEHLDASLSFVDRQIRLGVFRAVRLTPKMTRVDGDSVADYLAAKASAPSLPRGAAAKRTGRVA